MSKSSYTRGSGLLEGYLSRKRANKANSLIGKNFDSGRVLDLGCGIYPYFLVSSKFSQKYGIDKSINRRLVKGKYVNLIKMDISKKTIPFDKEFFDAITMLAVFEHIDEAEIRFVLSEARRVLKKRGIFIITTPAPWSDKLLYLMAFLNLVSKEEIHEHKHNENMKSIVNRLIEAGFKNENIKSGFFEAGLNMWFVAEK